MANVDSEHALQMRPIQDELSPGTLYPVLHQLEKAGYLRQLNRIVPGKVRKYYVLTGHGGHALSDARGKIAELVEKVLAARGTPRRSTVRKASVSATRPRRSGGQAATPGR
jgi:DNA-binding PadR family transcriptional regulator